MERIRLRAVAYGRGATAALADAIAEAKGADALSPVTVAVPSNVAGLSLRQALAGASTAGASRGLVNVRFLVMPRIAELLGAPKLAAAGFRPLTAPLRAGAVRATLARDPGPLAPVADHPVTARSLGATFSELRAASESALEHLARQSTRAAHVVRLYRAFRTRTQRFYDREDLAHAAAQAVRERKASLRDVGTMILFLPRRLSPAEGELVSALAERDRVLAILGFSADETADRAAEQLLESLRSVLGPPACSRPTAAPVATRVLLAPDPEEEVRSVLREALALLRSGTPLHRMAILYRSVEPYALLAHEQLRSAGIPHHGPAIQRLSQTLAGRVLLGLLALPERDFLRERVAEWLGSAPILERCDGPPVPAVRWNALSRQAGVVRGIEQWTQRLEALADRFRKERDERASSEEEHPGLLARLEHDAEQCERMRRFVTDLAGALDPGPRTRWSELAHWAERLVERSLGSEGRRAAWPEYEIEASRRVTEILDALAELDEIEPKVELAQFRALLEQELGAPATRTGRFGEGIFLAQVGDALGTEFDAVFVLGLAEGTFPPRRRDDALLPERDRGEGDGGLPQRDRWLAEERRDYLAALAAAPTRVISFARTDPRGERARLPARWLLETVSTLRGAPVYTTDLETLPAAAWLGDVPSFQAGLLGAGEPASMTERDLRSLLGWRRAKRSVSDHPLAADDRALARGLARRHARLRRAFTRWDGFVGRRAGLSIVEAEPVSPTALEEWARCPYRFFLARVLEVREVETPGEFETISPRERGALVHRVLEEFVRSVPARAAPEQGWSAEERDTLRAIAQARLDDRERAGVTGRLLLWRLERARILRLLESILDRDESWRREKGLVPSEVELGFGRAGDCLAPIRVPLPDGRTVAFRGRIDRVDRAPDGSRAVVVDYKTGSRIVRTQELEDDPVGHGRHLQLPVYGLAARACYSRATHVETQFWFVAASGRNERPGYPLDARTIERLSEVVSVIADGIERGLFPARPGRLERNGYENCRPCPYDRICPVGRGQLWERKRTTPAARAYVELVEGFADGPRRVPANGEGIS